MMACDVLLIVAMIVFLLKYQKTMQAILTGFLQTNTKNTAIQSVQADQMGRTYPPLFTLNLPKEEEIMDDLREITTMEYAVQVIMIIVCIAIVLIIMYFCCTKCRHTRTIFKYCFPFLPISRIVRTSRRTDLFVEVINVTKGNGIWAHFISTGCFPTEIQLSRPIQKDDVQIETICCICHANDKSASIPVSYRRRVTSRTEITCLKDAIKSQRTHTEYRSPIGANDIGQNPASGHTKRSQPIRGLRGHQSGTFQCHHSKVI